MEQRLDDVTVVIINYNGAKFLPGCLDKLTQYYYPRLKEILIVDNDSTDTSRVVAQPYLIDNWLRWVEVGENLGYSGGANFAFGITDCPYLILLNPDVLVEEGCLEQMRTAFSNSVGVMGCKLVYPYAPDTIPQIQHLAGTVEYPLALTRHIGAGQPDTVSPNGLVEAQYVTGALMLISRKAFNAVEGFDTSFAPAYFEETDFCVRVAKAGWRVVSCMDARAIHYESGSVGKASLHYFYLYHLNRLRYVLKHYNFQELTKDFLPKEEERLQALRHIATSNPEIEAEIKGLSRAYLEMDKLKIQSVKPTNELQIERELALFKVWSKLEITTRMVSQGGKLLDIESTKHQLPHLNASWTHPLKSVKWLYAYLRLVIYRRYTEPHLLELAAAQERFNVRLVQQLGYMANVIELLINSQNPQSIAMADDLILEALRTVVKQQAIKKLEELN